MHKILIIPYSRKLPNNIESPKNYPFWQNIVDLLVKNNFEVFQLIFGKDEPILNGVKKLYDYSEKQQIELLFNTDCWISVDTYFQHFAKYHHINGIVIWTLSNPEIFGYYENMNLYSDKKYFVKLEDSYLDWITISKKYENIIKTMRHLEPVFIYNKINEFINSKKK